jgi:hypothetical protein
MRSASLTSPRMGAVRRSLLAAALAVGALVVPQAISNPVTAQADSDLQAGSAEVAGAASAYRAINPIRILDTRTDPGIKRLWIESAFSIDPVTNTGVAAAAGVDPDEVTAVIVNMTMVNAGGGGFGTVWPTGSERLETSINNVEFEGHTRPSLVIAPLGLDNKISVYGSTTADVVLDVLGVFVESGPTAAGRFEPLGPVRAFDTREPGDSEFAANTTQTIDLTTAGVPADATGVVLNVTAIRSLARGYYRVWAAGQSPPEHSNVNVLSANYNAGNQVISGVTDGKIDVYSSSGGGMTIDITGYFTGAGGDPTTDGLFVPFTPGRLLDTRQDNTSIGLNDGEEVDANEKFALQVAGRLDIPASGAKAVALSLTSVRADNRGYLKAYANGAPEPETSSLNYTAADQVVPNHAITSINTTNGQITLQSLRQSHLAVDASGYFLDAGATPPVGSKPVDKVVDPGSYVPDPLPPVAPTTGPYDFLFDRGAFLATGVRPNPTIKAAWENCRPIDYALNVDLADNDAQIQVLIDSIEEMELYTGIDFRYGGVTSAGMNIDDEILLPESIFPQPPYKYLPPMTGGGEADLVIGFSNADDTPELVGGVIGVGGSLRQGADSTGRAESLRGFALIDLPDLYLGGVGSEATLRNIKATTTHEIGHMMGLGHVDTSTDGGGLGGTFPNSVIRDQLMFPALNQIGDFDVFDDGDQRGLYELYGNRPCAASGTLGGKAQQRNEIDWSEVEVYKPVDDFG